MRRIFLNMIFISCGAVFSCKQKPPPPTPPVPVNLDTVTAQHVVYYDKYPATTAALSQVTLLPQVQGYITGIFFTEGSLVKKGQELYEIDKRLYQAAVGSAEANLKVIQGNLAQAQQDADRYVYLNNYKAVAKQLYDHAVIALQVAKDSVKAAEEAVRTAKTNLSYAVIYAPFDGTIGFSQVKLGNMVTVGQTVLNTISTNDPMAVDFVVNEKQLAGFEQLKTGKQEGLPDSLFTILMPDNSLYPYLGKISIIDRAVDPQTGAITIRLVFPNPQHTLKVGMSCVVKVHNQDVSPQLLIPHKAIVEQMGEYFVFVVKDTVVNSHADSPTHKTMQRGPRLLAFQKRVQLGQIIRPNVIIKSGINEGDRIVVDGVQLLHEGSAVTTGSDSARKGM